MVIGLCWYQKGTNTQWTYNHSDYLMLDLQTISTLASITYIAHLDAYVLHLRNCEVFNDFIDDC